MSVRNVSFSGSASEKYFEGLFFVRLGLQLIHIGTLGAETFARRKIREIYAFREHKLSRIGQNRTFRVLNFRELTEKLIFSLF